MTRTSDDGCYPLSIRCLDAYLITYVDKNILISHGNQCQLAKVGVRWEIFERVEL